MLLSVGDNIRFRHLCRSLKPLATAEPGARGVTTALLARWMASMTPNLPRPTSELSLQHHPAVERFVCWLNGADILAGAYWLSSAYAFLVGKDQRKWQAMYFTPPHLAQRLLDNANDRLLDGPIIDPACGGAAFLAPAAVRIMQELERKGLSSSQILAHIEANVHGVDMDAFLCQLSVTFLRMVLSRHIEAASYDPEFRVTTGDGLVLSALPSGSYGLVLCNPPYRKMTRAETGPYCAEYGKLMRGQPNLYTLFIGRAMSLLRVSGTAVFLTPMSFLSGQSFTPIRRHLTSHGAIKQIDLIHDKTGVFLGAEQDSAITVWQRNPTDAYTSDIYILVRDGSWKLTGRPRLGTSDAPWPLPREEGDAELLSLFRDTTHTLSSYGYAVRTGCIVIHRNQRVLYQKRPGTAQRGRVLPLVWQSDISSNATLCLDEREKVAHRYVDMQTVGAPGVVRRPAVAVQRVTSDDQPRRLVCAVVPNSAYAEFGGVVGENHVCFIEQAKDKVAVDTDLLCSILRTRTIDRLFRCMSGATNVSAYELHSLPLPDPERVQSALQAGTPLEAAVRTAFDLEVPTPTSKNHERVTRHGENRLPC